MSKTNGAKFQMDCGCSPMGLCKVAQKMAEQIEFEEAGVRVLTDATLKSRGMAFAQSEVRLARQIDRVSQLRAAVQEHAPR